MQISQLEGQRVALWGWGREGRAAWQAVRSRLPELALTLFCNQAEAADAAQLGDARLSFAFEASGEQLAQFDWVVKSPGISPYAEPASFARARGTRFIGGTGLWFAERAADESICCVTGTKGKSTTSALLAHLLRAAGQRTALAGNIGLPLLELLDTRAEQWVVELSSYQTRDVAESGVRPQLAVVTNLFPEHLDWHGSQARYVEDKLALLTGARPQHAVLNVNDAQLAALDLPDTIIHWYGQPDGWHLRGDTLYRAEHCVLDTRRLPLPGRHNRGNLCAVLTALDVLGLDAVALAPQAETFMPLPNRLQTLGRIDGVLWVNDSISTTPHATLAALEVFKDEKTVVLVGGHDRGLDWQAFANGVRTRPPHGIVTLGANGARIHALLAPLAVENGMKLAAANDLPAAVEAAKQMLQGEGVLLLSPGAPSFGAYRDYVQRGKHFARLGGFDPELIAAIQGLGVG
ncbi:UDP-N-acetylmuramoyl-L-alanine--D-glutamate ligase [Lysobacteraceae bacterium NML95-0200]|nr:UDP-N-acetylmuramoyl-L-alanine--D-glutamate ligase [Xanthomonadaceae bacterium NML95-0200]